MLNRSMSTTLDRMMTLNRALDQAFSRVTATEDGSRIWVPAIDVVEKRDAYVVACELPGVDASRVDVGFEQNVLTIRGTKDLAFDGKAEELRVYAAERVGGAFERSVRLPEFVDGERISASYRDGLLTVTVPKAQAAQARKIAIETISKIEGEEISKS